MTTSERRNEILEVLCLRRFERVDNLAFEFNVTRRTIERDILMLSLEYPIYTTKGNGGGIHIDENYRLGKSFLKEEQQELLQRLLLELSGKDADVMKSVISKFGLKGGRK